jgi:hypothetical protein
VQKRLIEGDSWVHVFEETTFGGRLRILMPDESVIVGKIGSLIVGPTATVQILDSNDREIMNLPSKKLIDDFSKLLATGRVSRIRVSKAHGSIARRSASKPAENSFYS